ncbi:MAG: lipopolysaccharide biosynthesis protein [Saprospiraceae bacterium]
MRKLIQKITSQLEGYDFFDTLKHTSTYFSATILINVLGLISLPIYTGFLSESEFGIVEVFNSTIKLLAVLMTLNVHQAVSRYYFEEKNDFSDFLGSTVISAISVFSVTSLVCLFFKDSLVSLWNIPEELFYWVFPAVFSVIILAVFNHLFISKKQSVLVSKGQVFFSYSRFAGALLFLVLLTPAYLGRVVGDVIFSVIISAYLLYKIYPHIKWTFSKRHLQYILSYALPLVPFSISAFLLNYFDLFMINGESNEDAGLYAFAYKIGILFMGLDQALQNAGKPDFFKWMNNKDYSSITGQIKSIMKFEVLGSTFLILFAIDIGSLLASKEGFVTSLHLVPIIIIGYVFFGAYNFYARLIVYSKKTIYISGITILAGILNVFLNSVYIPIHGYEIAAYTTLVSYASMLAMGWLVVVAIMKLPPPPLTDLLLKISFIGLIFFVSLFIRDLEVSYFFSFLMKGSVFSIVFLVLFYDKIFVLLKGEE